MNRPLKKSGDVYRGWTISYQPPSLRPVTGLWRAERFGVGMGAGTEEALRHMIDVRIHERSSGGAA